MMRTIIKNLFAVAVLSMLLSSCATILNPTRPKITLWGLPDDEKVTVVTKAAEYRDVTLPIKVKVKRHNLNGQPVVITSNTTNQQHTLYLKKTFNGLSLGNIAIALVSFGGAGVGFGIDCATNCISKPSQKKYYIDPRSLGIEVFGNDSTEEKMAKNIDNLFE